MSQSSRHLNLPFIASAQAQKHVTHNETLLTLDALLFCSVSQTGLSQPPNKPAEGTRILISNNPEGEFLNHAQNIATFIDGNWTFFAPSNGWHIYCEDSQTHKTFYDNQWIENAKNAPSNNDFQNVNTLGIGATASQQTPFIVAGAQSLFDGNDSHRVTINKATPSETASVIFQTGYSGRAELGLTGNDLLSFKVTPDGQNWSQGPQIDTDGSFISPAFRTGEIEVSRDAISELTLPKTHGIITFMLKWGVYPQATHSGIFAFDIASSPLLVTLGIGPKTTNQNTKKLTGTTGPDNFLNVAVQQGKFIFENRIDTTATITYTIIG